MGPSKINQVKPVFVYDERAGMRVGELSDVYGMLIGLEWAARQISECTSENDRAAIETVIMTLSSTARTRIDSVAARSGAQQINSAIP